MFSLMVGEKASSRAADGIVDQQNVDPVSEYGLTHTGRHVLAAVGERPPAAAWLSSLSAIPRVAPCSWTMPRMRREKRSAKSLVCEAPSTALPGDRDRYQGTHRLQYVDFACPRRQKKMSFLISPRATALKLGAEQPVVQSRLEIVEPRPTRPCGAHGPAPR